MPSITDIVVGSMNGNINRAEFFFLDSFKLALRKIGKRHVSARHKGKSPIVVLDVKRPPHPLGQLSDKAKNAVVSARTGLGKIALLFKFKTHTFVRALVDFKAFPALRRFKIDGKAFLTVVIFVIEYIDDLPTVESRQRPPFLCPETFARRAFVYAFDFKHFVTFEKARSCGRA